MSLLNVLYMDKLSMDEPAPGKGSTAFAVEPFGWMCGKRSKAI